MSFFIFFFCKDCVVSPRIVYSHSVLEKQKQKNTQLRKSPFFERWYTLLYCRWTREMRTLAAVPRKTAGRKVTHCALRRETLNRERDHKLTNQQEPSRVVVCKIQNFERPWWRTRSSVHFFLRSQSMQEVSGFAVFMRSICVCV